MIAANEAPAGAATPAPETYPAAPGYLDLRMAAEWASGVRGRTLHFDYSDRTGFMQMVGAGGIPVRSNPLARRPEVARVELEVDGACYTLPPGHACALFWSESAVEKFLFPYFASAHGWRAAVFLQEIGNAWYGYPAAQVQVCALAYLCGPDPVSGDLRIDDTLGVVFLEQDAHTGARTLEMMRLRDFVSEYRCSYDPPAPFCTVPPPAGSPTREATWAMNELMHYVAAREVAEFASGWRGQPVWLTTDDGTSAAGWSGTDPVQGGHAAPYSFEAYTPLVVPGRPRVERVTAYVQRDPGAREQPVTIAPRPATVDPDAMFWTDSAVEKLVLPYYASVQGWVTVFFDTLLMGKWNGQIQPGDADPAVDAVAVLEELMEYVSTGMVGGDARGGLERDEELGDEFTSDVFTILHLPRSEEVSDTDPGPGGFVDQHRILESQLVSNRTLLLSLGEDGGVRADPLYRRSANGRGAA